MKVETFKVVNTYEELADYLIDNQHKASDHLSRANTKKSLLEMWDIYFQKTLVKSGIIKDKTLFDEVRKDF